MAGTRAKRKMKAGEESMPVSELERLAGGPPLVAIDHLYAGYGRMPVLHGLSLRVARGRSLCLVGPNGAGKIDLTPSTALGPSRAPSRWCSPLCANCAMSAARR
jgi:ATPase subunit of ABC transporter with duplicated ATPase domains